MKKLTIIKLLLIIWLKIVEVSKSTVEKVATTIQPVIKKAKFFYHLDNRDGLYLQKTLLAKGIIVILYKLQRKRTRYGTYFILPSLPNANQVVKGVLDMTGKNKSETIGTGRQIIFDCTGNPNVPVSVALLAAGTTGIDNYEGAHGTAVAEFYREMINAMEPILALFNNFVKLPINRAHAVSTLQSGGFHVVGPGGNHLAVFGVRNSVVAGEFLLTGDVDQDGKDGFHLWWYSLDNITWVPMRSTKKNKTKMGGFTRGELVYFRHELVIDDDNNPYPISNPISKTAQ
jgi:hypothetical protein